MQDKISQILRQLDSDRPSFSMGQSFVMPDDLAGDTLNIRSNKFAVDKDGNINTQTLTAAGDVVVQGDFTILGTQTFSGASALSASTEIPLFAIDQSGTGLALRTDNLTFKESTISTQNINSAILLDPNGAGVLQFHSTDNYIDSEGNLVLLGGIIGTSLNVGAGTIQTTGAITGTTFNGLTIVPSTGILTIADDKTLTVNNSIGLAGSDGKILNIGANNITLASSDDVTLTLPTSGTVTALGNTTTGTGSTLVLSTTPTFGTSIYAPLVIGGTGTTSDLTLQTTSGVGATGADMHFLVGNIGATEAMTILNSGNVGIGTTSPGRQLEIYGLSPLLKFNGDATGEPRTIGVNPYGFVIHDDNDNRYDIVINNDGNVGIGTTAPNAALHVAGSTVILGSGEGGTPQDVILRGPAASGESIAGADMYFDASNGTDDGGSGSLIFRTAAAGSAPSSNIEVDNTSSGTLETESNSFNWSHTVNSGSNGILIVGVSNYDYGGNCTISSITYGSASLTRKGRIAYSNYANTELWYLTAPDVGTANITVTFTRSTSWGAVGGAVSYVGVNQDTPWGTVATNSGSSSSPSVDVASAADELVVDVLTVNSSFTATAGDNQTQRWNTTAGYETRGAGSTKTGASSVTMSWTLSGSVEWAIVAAPLKPASGWTPQSNAFAARMIIDNGGNVGIATTSPAERLHVVGNIRNSALAGTGNRAVYSDANGTLTNSSSDIRLKTNIENLADNTDVLSALKNLRGIYYNWNTSLDEVKNLGNQREIGMAAQEVQAVLPELVGVNASGYLSLDYPKFTAYLLEVAKAQQNEIDNIKLSLNDLGLINATTAVAVVGDQNDWSPVQWAQNALANLGMVLRDGIASLREVAASKFTGEEAEIKKIKVEQMCVAGDDGETVCLTKDQLKELIGQKKTSATITKTYETDGQSSTSDSRSEPNNKIPETKKTLTIDDNGGQNASGTDEQ